MYYLGILLFVSMDSPDKKEKVEGIVCAVCTT